MLTEAERLKLQQLQLLAWSEERRAAEPDEDRETSSASENRSATSAWVESWDLTGGVDPYPWQLDAAQAWFAAGRRGTIKVVTGAGKTHLGLSIAEQLQHEDNDLRAAIVVPTIVLMEQWHAVLREHSNLPAERIGRLGGGHHEDFEDGRRVLIAVLASARKELPRLVSEARMGQHLLLVADECHRVGAPEMSAVLRTDRAYSLGLSATPEREDEDREDGGSQVDVATELGPVVYEMTFAQAVDHGVLPPFEIHHFGLPLNAPEAKRYSALTRSINDLRQQLVAASPAARRSGGGEHLLAWARRASARGGNLSGAAAKYVRDTRRRKQLLYRAESRKTATVELIEEALARRADARVILFHESIEEVEVLFELLVRSKMPAVMEHSELPQGLRERTLELFRSGAAQVVVSARSLIEGFNVPEADLGIVVASSSSPRQRIQSIGRVLRRYRDAGGEQKTSRVCVLYVRDTVDDAIYGREDWDKLIGLTSNRYFIWDPPRAAAEQVGPPRRPLPREDEIDVAGLSRGDLYPGRYDGAEYSTDSQGNVADADGRVALNPQDVPAWVRELRGRPGRFKLTPAERAVLVRQQREGEWETLFAGVLPQPFDFGAQASRDAPVDASRLAAGDVYSGPIEPAQELRFRQRRGGVLARPVRGGEAYARGPDAERAVATLKQITRERGPISKVFLNDLGHLFWRDAGTPRFLLALGDGLEFPSLQSG